MPSLLLFVCLLAAPAALAQQDLIVNGTFESHETDRGWQVATSSGADPLCTAPLCERPARTGAGYAFLGGLGITNRMSVSQTVTIPANAASTLLTYALQLDAEGDGTGSFTLRVDGIALVTYSSGDAASFPTYRGQSADLSAFADGQPHTITFEVTEGEGTQPGARFGALLDDVSLVVTRQSDRGHVGITGAMGQRTTRGF
ncbi:MAG: hypothetical protein AAGI52_07425 [Bacteroidota bacterium]